MATDVLPPGEARALAALDEARRAIELARDVGDVASLLEWRDRAAAVQHYVQRRDDARAVADDAGEVKIRAERAIGELDRDAHPRGRPKKDSAGEPFSLDVRRETRTAWRKLGSLDPARFDELVVQLRESDEGGVTTARAVRLAPTFLPKPKRKSTRQARTPERARREQRERFADHLQTAVANLRTAQAMLDETRRDRDLLYLTDPATEGWLELARRAREHAVAVLTVLEKGPRQ